MSTEIRDLDDVVAEMVAAYKARSAEWDRSQPYSRVQLRNMPEEWQALCHAAGPYSSTLHDLFVVCQRVSAHPAIAVPIPVTQGRFEGAQHYLTVLGRRVRDRAATWLTAIRALPPEARTRVLGPGLHDWVDYPQSPRRLNAAPGTFVHLSADLDTWMAEACRGLSTKFEEREPVTPKRAAGAARFIECAAVVLLERGAITAEISLKEFVSQEKFDLWLDSHDDHSPTGTLQTIDAFIRIRTDLFSRRDETIGHMRIQRTDRRNPHALSKSAVDELSAMLREQRKVELTPLALMTLAGRDMLPVRTRLKLANLAPAMQAALEFALRPGDVFNAEHDADYQLIMRTRLRRAGGTPMAQSPFLAYLLRQREQVRHLLGAAASRFLMANGKGAVMGNQECAQALARTQEQFGLLRHPWQRFRDFTAIRLLQDPSSLAKAADLLEAPNPLLVYLRYSALIPRHTPLPVRSPQTSAKNPHGSGRQRAA